MPSPTIVEIPPEEQVRRRAELRRARYGYRLALHLLLLCAAGRTPSEVASVLFCSRSSVYRTMRAYRCGAPAPGHDTSAESPPAPVYRGSLKRSVRAFAQACAASLRVVPHALELCRALGGVESAAPGASLARDRPALAP